MRFLPPLLFALFLSPLTQVEAQPPSRDREKPPSAQAKENEGPPPIVDYSNGDQLDGAPGVVDGTVQYHLQWPGGSYARQAIAKHLATVPDGGYMLWDTEPWLHKKEGVYAEGSEEDNLALFQAYAETLQHFTPELKRRKITLHVYQAPIVLARKFTVIRREEGHPHFEEWKQHQLRVLQQAEDAGMLEALRECKGAVALPAYLPHPWADGKRWAGHVGQLVENVDSLLDEHKVPHVWMMRPDCAGKPLAQEHVKVFLTGPARQRLAVWGTPDTPGWEELREALRAK